MKSHLIITARNTVTSADVAAARLGPRFGRMDLASQLALVAVEPLVEHFDSVLRERIAICLAVRAGSLSTDTEFWKSRDAAGGPSPTLFTYTLPSAVIGEVAIRHRLTGPGLCFVGEGEELLVEAHDLIDRGEADGCVCIVVEVVSPELAAMIAAAPKTSAQASFIRRGVAD